MSYFANLLRFTTTTPGTVASALGFLLARVHLIDDTYITSSYARNLAFHGHSGLLAEGTTNTATSPLNVLCLAALTFVARDAVFAAGTLYVVCQVLLVLALRRLGAATGLPGWFPVLTITALTVNPLLVSSIGMEVELGAAGLAWLLALSVERRPFALGLVAGMVALVRGYARAGLPRDFAPLTSNYTSSVMQVVGGAHGNPSSGVCAMPTVAYSWQGQVTRSEPGHTRIHERNCGSG